MNFRLINGETVVSNEMVTTTNTQSINLDSAMSFSIQAVYTVDTPSAKTLGAIDLATDIITITGHGLTTGLKGQVTTTGVLPTGISAATDYFVIVVNANSIKLANSLVNALAGTAIDISGAGSGTHTFTPTVLAGATVKLQKSNDGENWIDDAAATSITTTGSLMFEKNDPAFKYARLSYTLTAGRLSSDNFVVIKSNQ